MGEYVKIDKPEESCKCNVYITVNCGHEEKKPCKDYDFKEQVYDKGDKYYPEKCPEKKFECRKCNVYVEVNCGNDKKERSLYEQTKPDRFERIIL